MALSTAICNRLSDKSWSKVGRVCIANGACRRRNRDAFDALLVVSLQIRIVDHQVRGRRASDAKARGQCDVDLARARVRQTVDRER